MTSARRSGIEYMTPSVPPIAHTATVVQYGNPLHQPTITRPGSTKMIALSVPAAEAMVWTMLFSTIEWFLKNRRIPIEMTAAGIEVANVRPTLRPRYTFAAVKISVMMPPRMMPRTVSSRTDADRRAVGAVDMEGPFRRGCESDESRTAGQSTPGAGVAY